MNRRASVVVLALTLVACGSTPVATPAATAPPADAVTLRVPDGTPAGIAAEALDVLAARAVSLQLVSGSPVVGETTVVLDPVDEEAKFDLLALRGVRGKVAIVPLGNEDFEAGARIDPVEHPALVTGAIKSVEPSTDPTGLDIVEIQLSPVASAAFADYTRTHVGEFIAITLDDLVVVAPVVREPIPDGRIDIEVAPGSGPLELDTFIAVVESGVMPVELEIVR